MAEYFKFVRKRLEHEVSFLIPKEKNEFYLIRTDLMCESTLIFQFLYFKTQIEDNTMLVRALDKFYRKVQSVHQLMPESGMDRTASNIVAFSAHNRVAQYTTYLQDHLHGKQHYIS